MFHRLTLSSLLIGVVGAIGWSFELKAENGPDRVEHLFVVRRGLDFAIPRGGVFAHSAVLMRTQSGKLYLLEYMDDATSYVAEVAPQEVTDNGDHVIIKMNGRAKGGTREFEWTRQKRGVALEAEQTPQELRDLMQSLMNGYDIAKGEHCHAAQERLRRKLGLIVD